MPPTTFDLHPGDVISGLLILSVRPGRDGVHRPGCRVECVECGATFAARISQVRARRAPCFDCKRRRRAEEEAESKAASRAAFHRRRAAR
jgi:hypothetical protein